MYIHILGVSYALLAALLFGIADFSGGYASKKLHQFQVLIYTTFFGIISVGVIALILKQSLPSFHDSMIMFSGGVLGALGLAFLFKGLSEGKACIVSPTAGVVGAIIPLIFSSLFITMPTIVQGLGFVIGLMSIWLVSQHEKNNDAGFKDLMYGILAGLSFGLFFILIAQANTTNIFSGLLIAKIGSFLAALVLLKSNNKMIPSIKIAKIAILSGVIDAFSNVLYLFAKENTRLDIAVVLSSLYPVVTVILSRFFYKEILTIKQIVGLILSFIAIALVSI
ncbi:MAG: hypothetical protein A2381_19470 [Bdellovibrionales bacterium RIFOXYB1_FULL_37_110]|nr:MAG: hypothetical protein A2417_10970 [Bdellovibrionales bacterium RIFOXYC1_FULL_37_79]OFZ60660.1 MAG: hypothetical protein A2381_19470 [Bdellovibrionales bacterium RIFOXYB1_FULL_37_110]OFZ64412.1 MAG: hypothetical protein A2577_10120 [Bdellovibrionales bacterium RIFOXYD1_FULL_36_51]